MSCTRVARIIVDDASLRIHKPNVQKSRMVYDTHKSENGYKMDDRELDDIECRSTVTVKHRIQ